MKLENASDREASQRHEPRAEPVTLPGMRQSKKTPLKAFYEENTELKEAAKPYRGKAWG